jgi:hypothetical protein
MRFTKGNIDDIISRAKLARRLSSKAPWSLFPQGNMNANAFATAENFFMKRNYSAISVGKIAWAHLAFNKFPCCSVSRDGGARLASEECRASPRKLFRNEPVN